MSEQSTILQHLTNFQDRAGLSFDELHQINEIINTSDLMKTSIKIGKEFNDTKAGAMYLGINVAKVLIPGERSLSIRLAGMKLIRTIINDLKKQEKIDNVINTKLRDELSQVRFDVFKKVMSS